MRRALIVWGGWEGHQPEGCAHLFAQELRRAHFDVRIEQTLEVFSHANELLGLDLIVPIWTLAELSDSQQTGLVNAVRAGTGLGGFHGMCAFSQKPGYLFLTGGVFLCHPGDHVDYSIDIQKHSDPIVLGLKSFSLTSEQYYLLVDPANEVLATTTFSGQKGGIDWIAGVVMPAVWKRRYGQGRVFYASFGHGLSDFDVFEAREIVRRGLLWAARAL